MEDRSDLLLGIIVTHIAKQQQQQPVVGRVTSKTSIFGDHQELLSAVSVRSGPTTTSTQNAIIREAETIASPANQVMRFLLSRMKLAVTFCTPADKIYKLTAKKPVDTQLMQIYSMNETEDYGAETRKQKLASCVESRGGDRFSTFNIHA